MHFSRCAGSLRELVPKLVPGRHCPAQPVLQQRGRFMPAILQACFTYKPVNRETLLIVPMLRVGTPPTTVISAEGRNLASFLHSLSNGLFGLNANWNYK